MYSTRRGNKFILVLMLILTLVPELITYLNKIYHFNISTVTGILINQIGFILIPTILYFIITHSSIRETLPFNKIDIINILITIGVGICLQPLLTLVNITSQIFFENKISHTILTLTDYPLWLLLLLIAILPAINEEIVTRGILLTNYKNVNLFKAALISGLSFGMLHMNGNQFSYAFVMGTIMFILVKITNSIFSSMIIHFIINGIQTILAKLLIYLQTAFGDPVNLTTITREATINSVYSVLPFQIIITLITLPLLYLLFYAAVKYNKKEHLFKKSTTQEGITIHETTNKDKVIDIYLILSIIIFVVHVLINEIL